jgi:hypothetical protein
MVSLLGGNSDKSMMPSLSGPRVGQAKIRLAGLTLILFAKKFMLHSSVSTLMDVASSP